MEVSTNVVFLVLLGVFTLTEGQRGDTLPPGQTGTTSPGTSISTGTDADGNCVYSFHVPIEAIQVRPCPDSSDSQALAQLRADMAAEVTAANSRITQLVGQVELLQDSLAAQQRHIEALERNAAQQSSSSSNGLSGVLRPRRLFRLN